MLDKTLIEKAVSFHGHYCGGLAIGLRLAEYVLKEFGHSNDEELVLVVENNMCAVDALQAICGFTFGKGNLVFHDYGKLVFTVFRRSDGKAQRFLYIGGKLKADVVLQKSFNELFSISNAVWDLPPRTQPVNTSRCFSCQEEVIEEKLIKKGEAMLCAMCAH